MTCVIQGATLLGFPGQGLGRAQVVDELRRRADHPLVVRLARRCGVTDWSAMDLGDTAFAQPAVFVASMLRSENVLRTDRLAAIGHSLGEISALTFAGALDVDDGFELVAHRGRICAEVAANNPGEMIAVLGLPEQRLAQLCCEVRRSQPGVLDVAAMNAPEQFVLSGESRLVANVLTYAVSFGGYAVRLPIGGAFHSELMSDARGLFRDALEQISLSRPLLTWISSTDGNIYDDPAKIAARLEAAIVSPVRWHDAVATAASSRADAFVDVGPGNTLARIRIPQAQFRSLEDWLGTD